MWEIEIGTLIVPTVSTVILFIITINLLRYFLVEQHIQIQDMSKHHNWKVINKTSRAFYCSICEALLLHLNGLYCDSCGVYADHGCVKLANKKLKCKEITYSGDESMEHHWVKGNLPIGYTCSICKEECDSVPGLLDWWCCWCQRCVHDSCKQAVAKSCDFGEFKLMIIPPKSLEVINRRRTMRRRLQLRSIRPPLWPEWNPLIVVANRKSGSSDGDEILSQFRRLLNPAQVVDLTERDPVAALEWCRLLGQTPCNVLVAGGDGTVAWLLNAIHKLNLQPPPSVAVLPLGTGNDLSRVLGWGKEVDPNVLPEIILRKIQMAKRSELDRWNIKTIPIGLGLRGLRGSQHPMFMYNYLSIGVDAQVALNFHRTRESRFYLFSHRIFNKLLYLCFGTQQVVERECKDLDKRIEVYLDDTKIELPSLEGVIILNIPSWAAGVNVWNINIEEDEEVPEQNFNDEKLEVVGIHSSFHIAQLSIGLSKPHRLGQAHKIKIKLKEAYATQVDGEPWMQHPCEFLIEHCNRASVLINTDNDN